MYRLFFLVLVISLNSCSKGKYTQEDLLSDIIQNNHKSICDQIYNIKEEERKALAVILNEYHQQITDWDLKPVPYIEELSFKSRPRKGYSFVNEYNNTISSITYKEIALENDTLLNFIDFRRANNAQLCAKIPSLTKIKCAVYPIPFPIHKDTLKANYPLKIGPMNVYHTQMLSTSYMNNEFGDATRPIIQFNIDNLKLSANIEEIVSRLHEAKLTEEFIISIFNSSSEETTNILHYPDVDRGSLDIINSIIKNIVPGIVDTRSFKTPSAVNKKIITIGGVSVKSSPRLPF